MKLQGSAEELYPASLRKGMPAGIQQQPTVADGMELQSSWCRQYNMGQQPQTAAPKGENLTQAPGQIGGAPWRCEGGPPFLGVVVGAQIEPWLPKPPARDSPVVSRLDCRWTTSATGPGRTHPTARMLQSPQLFRQENDPLNFVIVSSIPFDGMQPKYDSQNVLGFVFGVFLKSLTLFSYITLGKPGKTSGF